MIEIGPIVMPCRTCNVKPGDPCEWAAGPRSTAAFHALRARDAKTASALVAEPRPARPLADFTSEEET